MKGKMSNAWNFPGSRWWKFDFHTHTPASYDYGLGDDSFMNITPEKWLQKAMQSGIDCVAVTDHNTGAWIDRLKAKNLELRGQEIRPDWYRELAIFPGIEITVTDSGTQVHLLAIFDPDTDGREIARVLGLCGITSGYGSSWEAATKTSFAETVEKIIEANGIAIPAHIDGPQGLLYRISNLTPSLAESLEKVFAAEFTDPGSFVNADPSLKKIVERFARVSSSDAHKPHETGRHYSWIKMSTPSIEGLRHALQDHASCVKNQHENPGHFPDVFSRN